MTNLQVQTAGAPEHLHGGRSVQFGRAALAHLAAIQIGALVVCVAISTLANADWGPVEGFAIWGVGQFAFLPPALVTFMPMTLLRVLPAISKNPPGRVAGTAGALVGCVATALLISDSVLSRGKSLVARVIGTAGGWIWWKVEQPEGIRN